MTDHDLRKSLLQQFYDRRGEGRLGIATGNTPFLCIPEGSAQDEVLRACERLAISRLIDWTGVPGPGGTILAGAGQINAVGIFAVEKRTPSIFGTDVAAVPEPAPAAPDSIRLRALEQYADYLVRGLMAAHPTSEKRNAARSRLAAFIATPEGRVIFGDVVPALLKLLATASARDRGSVAAKIF